MINFFRKIRKQLADDNKPLKYMRYAIGEIVLVVIGILIALSINNWNEGKKKQDLVKSQLLNLASSLESESSMWDRAILVSEFRCSSFEYLLKKADQSFRILPSLPKPDSTFIWQGQYPDSTNINFIRESFSWFTRGFGSIVIDRTAMNEINNLGLFSEIRNNLIKKKIHDYYSLIDFHFSNLNIQERINKEVEFNDYLRDKYDVNSKDILDMTDPLEFIKNDRGIIFRLKQIRDDVNWHGLQAINAKNMGLELIIMIEQDIGQ